MQTKNALSKVNFGNNQNECAARHAVTQRRKNMRRGRSFFVMLFILLIILATGHAGDLGKDLIDAVKT